MRCTAKHPSDNLALSGGCAMNSVANGKVYLNTPFKKMYLPAAAGDAGGAIGAAAYVAAELERSIDVNDQLVSDQQRTNRSARTSDLRSAGLLEPRSTPPTSARHFSD